MSIGVGKFNQGDWTGAEDSCLRALQRKQPNQWDEFTGWLGGRSANETREMWLLLKSRGQIAPEQESSGHGAREQKGSVGRPVEQSSGEKAPEQKGSVRRPAEQSSGEKAIFKLWSAIFPRFK
jgi:hypothetical protein